MQLAAPNGTCQAGFSSVHFYPRAAVSAPQMSRAHPTLGPPEKVSRAGNLFASFPSLHTYSYTMTTSLGMMILK